MKRVLLIFGEGDHGKTYLAKTLAAKNSFKHLSLDHIYVDFIKKYCPDLYFKVLNLYIGPHYNNILKHREHSKKFLGRDFIAEWYSHILCQIQAQIEIHDKLAVEGYVLYDSKEELETQLEYLARVFQIEVKDRQYHWNGQTLDIQAIANLGIDAS